MRHSIGNDWQAGRNGREEIASFKYGVTVLKSTGMSTGYRITSREQRPSARTCTGRLLIILVSLL